MDTKFLNWFLSGGSVAVPKRFLAYMATLELSFEELGEIVYLLAQEGRVSAGDVYAKTAATNLVQKHLITYNVDSGDVSFQPLFDRMLGQTTAGEAAAAQGNAAKESSFLQKRAATSAKSSSATAGQAISSTPSTIIFSAISASIIIFSRSPSSRTMPA